MEKEFLALVLFKIQSEKTVLYEEDFIQIKAKNIKKAKLMAEKYGQQQEVSFNNLNNQNVRQFFLKVIDVNEVLYEQFESNIRLLYSRHFKDLKAYKNIEKLLDPSKEL